MTLTPKQSAFVDEYLVDLCGKQAAIRAGYSKRTAAAAAARLLTNVNVRPHLQAAISARSRRTQVASDWVLKRLHDEAEADLADIYEKDGRLKPVHQWPEIWRTGLVASVETSIAQDGTRVDKVRLSDRLKRIEMIGKHVDVRAFVERKEVTGKDGAPLEAVMVFNPVGNDGDDPD